MAQALLISDAMKRGCVAFLALAGCFTPGPALHDIARARAVTDLNCPAEKVALYDAVDGSKVAQGCGAWMQYECFEHIRSWRNHTYYYDPLCVREAPAPGVTEPPSPEPPPPPSKADDPVVGAVTKGSSYPFE